MKLKAKFLYCSVASGKIGFTCLMMFVFRYMFIPTVCNLAIVSIFLLSTYFLNDLVYIRNGNEFSLIRSYCRIWTLWLVFISNKSKEEFAHCFDDF